ncbi:efflux RND transporter periplasmic adaptor subunit [Tenacibaculum sp. 190524A05c]|uniref:efflux RND transporter periplasmic adaptor subunit n=1 Tax=Tenacibaculum platacis TaxID=3137852 RepID=UPI0032B22503
MFKKSFLLIILTIAACGKENKTSQEEEIQLKVVSKGTSVEVVKVSDSVFNKQLWVNGKIEAVKKAELRFQASNQLSSVKVANGDYVKQHQIIGVLENSLLKNNMQKATIELQKAQNKLAAEKINYGKQNITPSILKNLEIKSGVIEARNNLERAKIEYDQTFLKAPFSAIVANIEKREGDYIGTADAFCTVINPNALEVSFAVLENEYQFIAKNQEVEVRGYNAKQKSFKGRITEVNPLVDENGLIKVTATIIDKNTGLLDGMNVKILINHPLHNVVIIPKSALVLRSNREVVFTIENNLAKWNYVEIAGENSDSYAVKKGLKGTDTVIISGNLNLAHNTKVIAE